MVTPRWRKWIASAALAGAVAAIPVAAQAPQLAMLDSLSPGSWELRDRNGSGNTRMCVRQGTDLIQIRHTQRGCQRYIIQDEADEVTVQYTCRGSGYGRTTIRKEGANLVQIRSQGVVNGSPFLIQGEARRTGGC